MSQIFQKLVAALGNVPPSHQQSEAVQALPTRSEPSLLTPQELLLIGGGDDPYAGPRGGWLV